MKYGLPGQYLTSGNRFAQLLAQQPPEVNNGSTAGGLAHMLNQGLLGYIMGKDGRDSTQADQLMAEGMQAQPWVNPDTGAVSDAPAGGMAGAISALGKAPGNEYAGRLSRDLMAQQAAQQSDMAQRMALADYEAGLRAKQPTGDQRDYQFAKSQGYPGSFNDFVQARRATIERAPTGYAPTAEGGLKPIPGGPEDPSVIADQERAKKQAAALAKREENQPKALSALQELTRKSESVVSRIDKALEVAAPIDPATGQRAPNPWATGYGSLLEGVPNTDARALRNELDTIRANIGFDKLQQMRDASPTGGALGQVSEMENRLLQAVEGALDPGQADQLVRNLTIVRDLYPQVLENRRAAYTQDYGPLPEPTPAPAAQQPAQSGPPQGVDPALWEVMTPEERALW